MASPARQPEAPGEPGRSAFENHSSFEELLHGLDVIVWEADPDTLQFSFVSERAEQILGYPLGEWLGEPNFWLDHIHPDDRELTVAAVREASARGQDHSLEYRAIAADGRVVWLCDIIKVDRDPQGRPRKLRGVMIDITGQREAEQALRASEERYRTLVETADDIILSSDIDGHLTFANQAVRELLGRDPQELLGRHFVELVAPEDISVAVEQFRNLTRGRRTVGVEARLLGKDGRVVVGRFNAGPLRDAEGRIVGATAIGRDVTEAKRREEKLDQGRTQLQQMVDGTTSTIHVKDLEGRYLLVNSRLQQILGRPREQLLGRTDSEVLAPEGVRRSQAHDQAALRAGGPVEREGPMPCAGGSRTFLTVKFPLFDGDGEPYAVCGIGTDISDRKAAEEEIARLASERARLVARSLESEERERRRISEALHDEVVQTLLTVRQDLMEAHRGDGVFLDRAAAGIDRTLEQLRTTIRELHPVALAHSDLPAALRSVMREIESLGHVELELDVDEQAGGGPDQLLLSAARELALNVVKHSKSQRARVSLRRANGEVRLEVADEGVGIPDDRLQRARGEGHIGLAALQERVIAAGGRFELDSSPEGGTAVQVSLPHTE